LPPIKSLCVFCASRTGDDPRHVEAARTLGRLLAEAGIRLVYGGGRAGMMGALADAALEAGGKVTGIIPEHLMAAEHGHTGLDELIVVDSMHTRKHRMFEVSDAFAVLPGGIGTMDETFEIITWKQLRLHDKPVIVVNVGDYWRGFDGLIAQMVGDGFCSPATRDLYTMADGAEDVLPAIARLPAPARPAAPERL
jgi:uncharacterized protein (TIGR00730 family)